MALIVTGDAARRLARAIASDINVYNEAKILRGLEGDDLFDLLGPEIEEGRTLYKKRVSPELFEQNFFDCALVDVLLKVKGHIPSKLW